MTSRFPYDTACDPHTDDSLAHFDRVPAADVPELGELHVASPKTSRRVLVVGTALLDRLAALRGLSSFGWVLRVTPDAAAARRIGLERGADVVLLATDEEDAALGLGVCQALRRAGSDLPIVAFAAEDTVARRVAALESGADDLVVGRAISVEELHGRLTVALRAGRLRSAPASAESVVRAGPIQVNLQDEAMMLHGKVLHLPLHQRALLIRLAASIEQAVPRADLCAAVGMRPGVAFKNLHNEVFRIRARLGAEAASHIRSVRGQGYMLTAKRPEARSDGDDCATETTEPRR